jgi:hypothetical protein
LTLAGGPRPWEPFLPHEKLSASLLRFSWHLRAFSMRAAVLSTELQYYEQPDNQLDASPTPRCTHDVCRLAAVFQERALEPKQVSVCSTSDQVDVSVVIPVDGLYGCYKGKERNTSTWAGRNCWTIPILRGHSFCATCSSWLSFCWYSANRRRSCCAREA